VHDPLTRPTLADPHRSRRRAAPDTRKVLAMRKTWKIVLFAAAAASAWLALAAPIMFGT
jgi:hypothetical protein